jgi:putative endonuclease
LPSYFVYILSSSSGTLYTGVTNDLHRWMYEHKNKLVPGFTERYNVTRLVYFEETRDIDAAIRREKEIKGWLRKRKIELIVGMNPTWKDLSEDWFEHEGKSKPT